jgi:hypothetical protein
LEHTFFALLIFFLLEQKETKIQGERPTSIYPAISSQNGGSLSFAKNNRTITNVCRADAGLKPDRCD